MATKTHYSEVKEESVSSAPPRASASQNADEISLLDVLIVLAERRRMILYLTAAFAILSLVVAFVWPKSYTATAVLMPPRQPGSIGSLLSSELGSLGGMAELAGGSLGIKNPNDMYVGMLKSQTVEDAMVQKYGLMAE